MWVANKTEENQDICCYSETEFLSTVDTLFNLHNAAVSSRSLQTAHTVTLRTATLCYVVTFLAAFTCDVVLQQCCQIFISTLIVEVCSCKPAPPVRVQKTMSNGGKIHSQNSEFGNAPADVTVAQFCFVADSADATVGQFYFVADSADMRDRSINAGL